MLKTSIVKAALACCVFVALTTPAHADSFTFSTQPASGNISGPAGSSIGWGYTIVNLSTNWLVTTNLSADPFFQGTPDASLFDFPIIGPGATLSVGFIGPAVQGLYGLKWDVGAPNGFTNSGTFILSAEFWDGDPLANGNFLASADDQSAPYSASVSGVSTVPEPPSFVLLGFGLAIIGATKRRLQPIE